MSDPTRPDEAEVDLRQVVGGTVTFAAVRRLLEAIDSLRDMVGDITECGHRTEIQRLLHEKAELTARLRNASQAAMQASQGKQHPDCAGHGRVTVRTGPNLRRELAMREPCTCQALWLRKLYYDCRGGKL